MLSDYELETIYCSKCTNPDCMKCPAFAASIPELNHENKEEYE